MCTPASLMLLAAAGGLPASAAPLDTGAAPLFAFDGDAPTNLLFISIDTTRRDQIGYFGYVDSSPSWDAVLSEGVVLEDHRSCSSWTAPSMACATTGVFPIEDGWWPTGVYGGSDALVPAIPDELPNLALTFKDLGYATALVTANGVFSRNNGGISTGYEQELRPIGQPAGVVATRALDLLRTTVSQGKPWLFHVHFMDPHAPYSAPDDYVQAEIDALGTTTPFDFTTSGGINAAVAAYWSAGEDGQELIREHLKAAYRAEIRFFDDAFADFWAELDAMGVLDDTLVVFWTDHGEQHGEHDQFYHGLSLHSQENRALAAFWAKNLTPAAWTERTFHYDIAPTIYDIMGVTPDYDMYGEPAGSVGNERVGFTFNYLVGYTRPEYAVFKGDMQLYYKFSGSKYLFDLSVDPDGARDIYDPADPRALQLWSELYPMIGDFQAQFPHLPAYNLGP